MKIRLPILIPDRGIAYKNVVRYLALAITALTFHSAPAVVLNLASPLDYQVVQRATRTEGKITIAGTLPLRSPSTTRM